MFPLYAIVDADLAVTRGYTPPELGRRFLEGGARLLQLRAKAAASGQLLEWADALAADARACGATLIINDRADVAVMAGASGVHVGQDDMPPAAVRAIAPAPFLIGLSTHTPAQITAGAAEPVDHLAIGPVFETRTKETGYAAVGLDMVREAVRRAAGRPVVAIGGITLGNARSVIDAGAASVAVISDLLLDGEPEARAAAFVRALA